VEGRGQATFPAHHERDERVRPRRARPGAVPTFHSFRHMAASHAIAAGESAEEVSWQLGHRNSIVTRAVYVHELKTAERTARRRKRMEADPRCSWVRPRWARTRPLCHDYTARPLRPRADPCLSPDGSAYSTGTTTSKHLSR
jgi:hypothetical protein